MLEERALVRVYRYSATSRWFWSDVTATLRDKTAINWEVNLSNKTTKFINAPLWIILSYSQIQRLIIICFYIVFYINDSALQILPSSTIACPRNNSSSLQQVYTPRHDKLPHRYPFTPGWREAFEIKHLVSRIQCYKPDRTRNSNSWISSPTLSL